jgi:hypothetical protein
MRSWVKLRTAHHLSLISTQIRHWSWRQQVPRKHWHPCTRLLCVLRRVEPQRDAKDNGKLNSYEENKKGSQVSSLSEGHCTAILSTPTSWKKKIGYGNNEFNCQVRIQGIYWQLDLCHRRQAVWMAGTSPCGFELTTFHNVRYWRESPLQRPLVFKLLQQPMPIPQLRVSKCNATVSSHRTDCFVNSQIWTHYMQIYLHNSLNRIRLYLSLDIRKLDQLNLTRETDFWFRSLPSFYCK